MVPRSLSLIRDVDSGIGVVEVLFSGLGSGGTGLLAFSAEG